MFGLHLPRRLITTTVAAVGAFAILSGFVPLASADHGDSRGVAEAVRECKRDHDPGRARGQCIRDAARNRHDDQAGLRGLIDRAALAQFFGITPQQLRAELQGRSLAQVAQAHGRTRVQLRQFILQSAQQRLATAVANGTLSQAEATRRLERLTQRLDEVIDRVQQSDRAGRGRNEQPGQGPGRGRGRGAR